MSKELKYGLLNLSVPVAALLLRLLGKTYRWKRRYDFDLDKGKILAIWHRHLLAGLLLAADQELYALVSKNRDGEIAARIALRLGIRVVRGSSEEGRSGKGGREATIRLLRLLRDNQTVAITVDGPKGPALEVKRGVVYLAQKSKKPIVPVSFRFSNYLKLNTWDSMEIPKPFSVCEFIRGREIEVSPGDDLEAKRLELQRELLRLSSSS